MIKYLIKDFDKTIEGKKYLVDFYADWCGPCKMLAEVLENVQDKIDMDILKVDVDKFPEVASYYNVFSIPTIYIIDDKKIIKSHTGYLTPDELVKFVKEK